MKIERLNENSIRCTLTSFDLSVRDLNIGELAYGTDKVKKLFTEMMTRASNEVGFEVDGTPIMIEAIPLTNDSIQLVITKVNNPEELDARFSRFSPLAGGLQGPHGQHGKNDDWLHRLTSELLEGASGFLAQMHQMQEENRTNKPQSAQGIDLLQGGIRKVPSKPGEKPEEPVIPEHSYRAVGFEDLDTVLEAVRAAAFYRGDSKLYRKPGTARYVLLIHGTRENHSSYAKACNVLAEYGRSIHTTPGTDRYYEEHYDLITKSPAIVKLASVGDPSEKKARKDRDGRNVKNDKDEKSDTNDKNDKNDRNFEAESGVKKANKKEIKEAKEAKEAKITKETEEAKETKETKEIEQAKEAKITKETKESKETKETREKKARKKRED